MKRQVIPQRQRFLLLLFIGAPLTAAMAQEPPRWLNRQEAVYPSAAYIVGTGAGRTRAEAEDQALAQISRFFSAKVSDSTELLYRYNEVLGVESETSAFSQTTRISSQAEFFGVEFAESYTDRNGVIHALACIDRGEAVKVYAARIRSNSLLLGDLIDSYERGDNPFAAVRKLRRAKSGVADLLVKYADMAALMSPQSAGQFASLPALISRLDRAIADNQARLTLSVALNDERARSVALTLGEMLRQEGFLITDTGGVYTASIHIEWGEGATANYRTVRPRLDFTLGLRNGGTLARYQKEYAAFRHITAEEALNRALRAIEQDLGGMFSAQIIRSIEE